jgi:Holliday junction DNA helicase RuvA
MIASLSGKIIQIEPDSIVIDVGGVGLQVHIPSPVKDYMHPGESVYLYTYLVVRQDALTLYGFDTKEGREYFHLLLSVNGIGPKLGLSILSVLTPDAIRRAVFNEQADVFSRVPGIGKKTAQKILLYLHDRIKAIEGLEPIAMMSDLDTEVLSALTALGYSVVEAQAALQSIPREAPQVVEEHLRLALQYFAK